MLEPVRAGKGAAKGTWTEYLVLFLRVMAGISLIKGFSLGPGLRHRRRRRWRL